MKKSITLIAITVAVACCPAFAQMDANKYMQTISGEFRDITSDMWDYTSAVAHGKSARKVEHRRKDVLKSNLDAQKKIQKLPDFEGDKSFRDSVISFLQLNYHIINYDYAKIVDMEAIAEESYDAMEAYLAAQEQANQKLKISNDMVDSQQKIFCANHKINLIEGKDKTSAKLAEASKVFNYYNKIHLVFFKAYKQEVYMIDAMNKNDVNALKQNADALAKIAGQGLKQIDTLKAFKGDNTLIQTSKELMGFYLWEAKDKSPVLLNFSVKKENFEKIKANFDSKPKDSLKKGDVDEYNNGVSEYSKASNEYNAVNQELNVKRTTLLNKYNVTVASFLDRQVPKYK
jgi:hypothetical protein